MKKHFITNSDYYKSPSNDYGNDVYDDFEFMKDNKQIIYNFKFLNEDNILTHFAHIQLKENPNINDLLILDEAKEYIYIITDYCEETQLYSIKYERNVFKL